MPTKRCRSFSTSPMRCVAMDNSNCGATKPIEEFYPRPVPENPHRRHRQCKDCQKIKAKLRYAADPEPARQRSRKYCRHFDPAAREKRRASARASHAERVRAAGRTYRPLPQRPQGCGCDPLGIERHPRPRQPAAEARRVVAITSKCLTQVATNSSTGKVGPKWARRRPRLCGQGRPMVWLNAPRIHRNLPLLPPT